MLLLNRWPQGGGRDFRRLTGCPVVAPGHTPSVRNRFGPTASSSAEPRQLVELAGHIGAAGFASGDRLVVGAWTLGAARADDRRDVGRARTVEQRAARAVGARRRLHRLGVPVRPDRGGRRGGRLGRACAEGRRGSAVDPSAPSAAAGRSLPRALRPAWVHALVEGPIARLTLGVRTYGVTAHRRARVVPSRPLVVGGLRLGDRRRRRPRCDRSCRSAVPLRLLRAATTTLGDGGTAAARAPVTGVRQYGAATSSTSRLAVQVPTKPSRSNRSARAWPMPSCAYHARVATPVHSPCGARPA